LNVLIRYRDLDLNKRDDFGRNVLHHAAESGSVEMLKYILNLDNGYMKNYIDKTADHYENALYLASTPAAKEYIKKVGLELGLNIVPTHTPNLDFFGNVRG
jgi:ankyrin repeat protein